MSALAPNSAPRKGARPSEKSGEKVGEKKKRPRPRPRAVDFSSLNPRQGEAVMHDEGPLLVLAGAGSGKTRVITYRIARLMLDGIPAERILGLTFTNKAAKEMRERLRSLVGPAASDVHLSTFHSLGLSILKEEYELAGLRKGFCIYDTSDQLSLLRDLMRQIKVADRRLDVPRVLDLILKTKRMRETEVALDWGDDYELAAYELYPRYLEQMRAFNAIDFDDLLLKTQDVLEDPDARQRWATRYDYLLVDEYQDTSPDQLELVRVLAGEKRNVCVVGDDDQAIYAWRGAAVDNILSFGKHFPGTHEVILDQNYRSTGHILRAANTIIANNTKRKLKKLWSADGDGEPVQVVETFDGEDEASFVGETIQKLLYDGVDADDIAVLYRANVQSRAFEEQLAADHVPFRVVGGQAFHDRKEVRDALAFLSVMHNPRDEVSLRRIINVPPRGIGPGSLEKLVAFGEQRRCGLWGALRQASSVPDLPKRAVDGAEDLASLLGTSAGRLEVARPGDAAPVVKNLFEHLKLRDVIVSADDAPKVRARRLENLEEVVNSLARFEQGMDPGAGGNPLTDYLRSMALVRNPSEDEANAPGQVTLMTLHSAKGLEFPYVFMVGVEEDQLPHRRSMELGGELSEERRLCYVGITRARKRLWMTWAQERMRYGQLAPRTPSRFLQELPVEGVVDRGRETTLTEEENDKMAEDFFAKMRDQLGIDPEE